MSEQELKKSIVAMNSLTNDLTSSKEKALALRVEPEVMTTCVRIRTLDTSYTGRVARVAIARSRTESCSAKLWNFRGKNIFVTKTLLRGPHTTNWIKREPLMPDSMAVQYREYTLQLCF